MYSFTIPKINICDRGWADVINAMLGRSDLIARVL